MAMQIAMMKSNSNKERFRIKLAYLKDAVDSRYLVENLGFKIHRETSKELRGPCIVHGGDNTTSFRFNKERRTWVCFSHKCHEIFGNDIIGLIKATQKIEFMDAVNYLSRLAGDIDSSIKILEYKRKKEREDFINYTKKGHYIHPEVDEVRLSRYSRLRSDYFVKEDGFDNATLDYFEIAGGYNSSDGLIRDIIPIRDADGILMAYSLRDIRPNADDESKYIHTPGFEKNTILYNLYRIIPVDKPIIVVEGFKSVWRLYEYGIKNVVAVMGSKITTGQQQLLCSHALHGIVILFDNDAAGALGAVDSYEALKDKMNVKVIFITEIDENGKGLDPADLDKDTIYNYLDSYI